MDESKMGIGAMIIVFSIVLTLFLQNIWEVGIVQGALFILGIWVMTTGMD